jgi:hypothetical protein
MEISWVDDSFGRNQEMLKIYSKTAKDWTSKQNPYLDLLFSDKADILYTKAFIIVEQLKRQLDDIENENELLKIKNLIFTLYINYTEFVFFN